MHAQHNLPQKRALSGASSHDNGRRSAPTPPGNRLKTINLKLSEEEHQELDKKVNGNLMIKMLRDRKEVDMETAPILLTVIIDRAQPKCSFLETKYCVATEAENLLKDNPGLFQELQNAWVMKHYAVIRSLEILQRKHATSTIFDSAMLAVPGDDQMIANIKSWQCPYIPGAAGVFLNEINARFRDRNENKMYANHVAVVQSSGMGKSRMLHEVSSKVFGIIFNFAPDSSTGFPRPDGAVRDYLSSATDVQDRATRFFMALFMWLRDLNPKTPSELQHCLAYGDSERYSQRQKILLRIINQAEDLDLVVVAPELPDSPSLPKLKMAGHKAPKSLDEIAAELEETVFKKIDVSLVKLVLGFDEANELTTNKSEEHETAFTEIRRALRAFRPRPIYTAFMSTTGSIRQFHPRANEDTSSRVEKGLLFLWPPYTLLGYDQLAEPLRIGCTLDDVTDVEFMLGLGRPLWKSRYLTGSTAVQEGMVQFAKKKLLNTDNDIKADRSDEQAIAPLAVRLPLTFNALTANGQKAEHHQIESHMRICLNIDSDADAMYSVAPSEPILNEAASQVMEIRERESSGDSIYTLHKFLSNRYLSKGDRGELACMLLLLLAHDHTCKAQSQRQKTAQKAPQKLPDHMPYNKPIRVTEFLTNLFAERHNATIMDSRGAIDGATLKDKFRDSWMHFTHFIKVHDYKVVNRNFLMRAMARGAAIVCANNQLGIDVILPYLLSGKDLKPDNPRKSIITKMDARKLGVYEAGCQDPPPVINVVFSVGTKKASLSCRKFQQRRSARLQTTKSRPERFEIFAAALSHETFRPVQPQQESTWHELVSRSGVEDILVTEPREDVLNIIRRMTPCAREHEEHWAAFFPLGNAEVSNDDLYGMQSSDSDSE